MKKITKISIGIVLLGLYLLSVVAMASALVIKDVSTEPIEIAPGDEFEIEIGIKNDFEDIDVINVEVVLDLSQVSFAPFESGAEDSIDNIKDGKTEYVRFKLIALSTIEPRIHNIPVIISYSDEDGNPQPEKNSWISIKVSSEPVISVSFKDSLLLKGKNEEIELKIINEGLSDVKFLKVELESSAYFDLLTQKNVYIGKISSDDFDSVKFRVFFKKDAPDKVNLPVIVRYKDSTNEDVEKMISIPVSVYTKEKAIKLGLMQKSQTGTYIGIGVAVVVLFFGYRYWRKRKRLKRASNREEY